MKELTLDESKRVLFDILVYIDKICRENGIKYSLGEGTLLGAVRHKGFIPWDDDIDILMKREEVDKFMSVFKEDKYTIFHVNSEHNYWNSVVRVTDPSTRVFFGKNDSHHGVWVALTPLDNIPDNEVKWNKMQKKIDFWVKLCRRKKGVLPYRTGIIGFLQRVFFRFVNISVLDAQFKKCITCCNSVHSKFLCKLNIKYKPFVIPSYFFDSYIDMEFEGLNAMVISRYDDYLKLMYGDYMQLPPIEERVPKHNFTAFKK